MKKKFKILIASFAVLGLMFVGFSAFNSNKAIGEVQYFWNGDEEWELGNPPAACGSGTARCSFKYESTNTDYNDLEEEVLPLVENAFSTSQPAGQIFDGETPTGIFIEYKP
jgi:hypothetical protein